MLHGWHFMFLASLVLPRSGNEEEARREFILNVILIPVIALFAFAFVHNLVEEMFGAHNPLSLLVLFSLLAFFSTLYLLSRAGFIFASSLCLVVALFLFAAYMGVRWGVNLPASILLHVLFVVISGVLVGTRVAFYATGMVIGALIITGTLHNDGVVPVDNSWALSGWQLSEIIIASLLFLVIVTVSWLSNREIEKSLNRARASEAALKEERDALEVRVEERTRALRAAQMEKIRQAYRFVEFGRLAGGLFHDLASPLTALSLTIERMAASQQAGDAHTAKALSADIGRTKRAMLHMQRVMDAMRRQLAGQGKTERFSLNEALAQVCEVLTPAARARQVHIVFDAPEEVVTFGDATALVQALTNLVSNAIDAYPPQPAGSTARNEHRQVHLLLCTHGDTVSVLVRDFGAGIPADVAENVFDPFFSTKHASQGLGIGLSLARRTIEQSFRGTLLFTSQEGKGSSFVVTLPLRKEAGDA